ncbi:MAG: hypothetical protein Q9160_008241 [Pyrenula sp. 1 TL-2023]
MEDRVGHGTFVGALKVRSIHTEEMQVAGIVQQNAEAAQIVNVKVWRDAATRSTIDQMIEGKLSKEYFRGTRSKSIEAFDDIIQDHRTRKTFTVSSLPDHRIDGNYRWASKPLGWRGSVINMSFGWDTYTPDAFRRVLAKAYGGIVICVAACNGKYERWADSDYGPNIRIFAPGQDIISGTNQGDRSTVMSSGTSFAAPAVAAALAIWVSFEKITDDTRRAYQRLDANMIPGIINQIPPGSGTTNNLVNTGLGHPMKFRSQAYFQAPATPAP